MSLLNVWKISVCLT